MVTPVQLQILRERHPGIGDAVLLRNASLLMEAAHKPAQSPLIGVDVVKWDNGATKATKARKSKGKAVSKASGPKAHRVPRTRNGGTWSEAKYFQTIRSGLRRMFRFWKPAAMALQAARVPCRGANGQKWAYVCADCGKVFPRKAVQIDHITPCGALTELGHIADFLQRLTPENTDAFAVRCLACHQNKTNTERI